MRCESDPQRLQDTIARYLKFLSLVDEEQLFGQLVIYPVIGVDVLPVLQARALVGVNWASYTPDTILAHLSTLLSPALLCRLRLALDTRLTYLSRVDASHPRMFNASIEPYRSVSRKSVFLKGIYSSLFAMEWDSDTERFYPVPTALVSARAERWLARTIAWLSVGDSLIVFDRKVWSILSRFASLREVSLGLTDPGEAEDVVFAAPSPTLLLPAHLVVFTKTTPTRSTGFSGPDVDHECGS